MISGSSLSCGRWPRSIGVLIMWVVFCAPASGAACIGDCDGDGRVRVNEIVTCVDISLGRLAMPACPTLNDYASAGVSISELVAAVSALLNGCPTSVTPTPSLTPTPSDTATTTPTPTVTPTATINLPPVLTTPIVYRAFPGFDIELPLVAGDPNGDPVVCTADALPERATIDAGYFRWTPSAEQVGPYTIPFICADDGSPPATVQGKVTVKVQPSDPCAIPHCGPELGCTVTFPPLDEACCMEQPTQRAAEPTADCPEGLVVFSGRNQRGFGRLQNCDRLRILEFNQSGAVLRFNVEGRCFNAAGVHRVIIHTRLETAERLALDDVEAEVFLDPADNGFDRFYSLALPIDGGGPFFDLTNAEAHLTVTVTDVDGNVATNTTRVVLTFDALPELPELE